MGAPLKMSLAADIDGLLDDGCREEASSPAVKQQLSPGAKAMIAKVRGGIGIFNYRVGENGTSTVNRCRLLPPVDMDIDTLPSSLTGRIDQREVIHGSVVCKERGTDPNIIAKARVTKVRNLLSYLNGILQQFTKKDDGSALDSDKRVPSPFYDGRNGDGTIADKAVSDAYNWEEIFVLVRGLQDSLRLRADDNVVVLADVLRLIRVTLNDFVKKGLEAGGISRYERQALDEFLQCALLGLVNSEGYAAQGVFSAEFDERTAATTVNDLITDEMVVAQIKAGQVYRGILAEKESYTDIDLSDDFALRAEAVGNVLDGATRQAYLEAVRAEFADVSLIFDVRAMYNVIREDASAYDTEMNTGLSGQRFDDRVTGLVIAEMRKKPEYRSFARMDNAVFLKMVQAKPEFNDFRVRCDKNAKDQVFSENETRIKTGIVQYIANLIADISRRGKVVLNDCPSAVIARVFLDARSTSYRTYVKPAVDTCVAKTRADAFAGIDRRADEHIQDNMQGCREKMIAAEVARRKSEYEATNASLYGVSVHLAPESVLLLRQAMQVRGEKARASSDNRWFLEPVVQFNA